jgi:hypothetical protein
MNSILELNRCKHLINYNNFNNKMLEFTKFDLLTINKFKRIFQKNQQEGFINKLIFYKITKKYSPLYLIYDTRFADDLFNSFNILKFDGLDIIEFILAIAIMSNNATFISIEEFIFDIFIMSSISIIPFTLWHIKDVDNILFVDDIIDSFIPNNNYIYNRTLFSVEISNEIFDINLQLFIDILVQEFNIYINNGFMTVQQFKNMIANTEYNKIIMHLFLFKIL